MTDNPFQSPQVNYEPPEAQGINSGTWDDLRKVAIYQKGVLFGLLAMILPYIGIGVLSTAAKTNDAVGLLALPLILILFVAGITSMVFVFLLAIRVYHPAVGIILGLLTLVPCLGILILLSVNGRATHVLQSNKIKVGFMGARMSDLDPAIWQRNQNQQEAVDEFQANSDASEQGQ